MGTPDWNAWLATGPWGPSADTDPFAAVLIQVASNVVVGQNPPYSLQNFFTMYPKFAGAPLLSGAAAPEGTFTAGSAAFTVNTAAGMAVGQPIAGAAIPDNSYITAISGLNVTMSNPATQTIPNTPIIVWNAPIVPVVVLLAFIALAQAHLVQARWLDSWVVAMGWFVAHFATLYARSDGNVSSNAGQIAAQGAASGIQVAKSAGDVSVSYQVLQGIQDWGAWNLTLYGQQLASMAKIIGMGPLFLY